METPREVHVIAYVHKIEHDAKTDTVYVSVTEPTGIGCKFQGGSPVMSSRSSESSLSDMTSPRGIAGENPLRGKAFNNDFFALEGALCIQGMNATTLETFKLNAFVDQNDDGSPRRCFCWYYDPVTRIVARHCMLRGPNSLAIVASAPRAKKRNPRRFSAPVRGVSSGLHSLHRAPGAPSPPGEWNADKCRIS